MPGPDFLDTNILVYAYDTRDRQSGGAGLGLAIASRVVELHGGKIGASNAPGGGLQVDISIPATT